MIPMAEIVSFALRLTINQMLIGAPVALGIAIAFRLTRGGRPRLRYGIAVCSFLLAAVLPFVVTSDIEAWQIFPRTESDPAQVIHKAKKRQAALVPENNSTRPISATFSAVDPELLIGWLLMRRWGFGWFSMWIIVSALLVGRELAGLAFLRRAQRKWEVATEPLRNQLGWPEGVPLLVHQQDGPMTVGWWRSVVVLPVRLLDEFSPGAIKRIARHELSHARWRDPLINSLLRLIRAALWPSVPLWVLMHVVCAEREAAADRAALEPSEDGVSLSREVTDYAESLIAIARWSALPGRNRYLVETAAPIGNRAGIEERVCRLLAISTSPSLLRMSIAVAALMVCFGTIGFIPVLSHPQANEGQRRIAAIERIAVILSDLPEEEKKARIFHSLEAMNRLFAGLKGRDWVLAGENATAFEEIRQRGMIDPLLLGLKDNDELIVEKSAWTLGHLEDRRAVGPLVWALSHQSPRVRGTTAWALGMLGDPRTIEALMARLKDDGWPAVRQSVAWALGMIGDRRAVEPLISSLKDDWADARHASAWALGMIGDRQAVEPLMAQLNDGAPDVRQEVARVLGQVGDLRASEALRRVAAEDRDENVRRVARESLNLLSSR